MRKMKYTIIMVAIILLLAGCNLREKIGENIAENAAEEALGEDADINVEDGDISISDSDGEYSMNDEDGFTFKGEDGSVVSSGGDYEWPVGQAADYLPTFNKGKINYILNSADACMVTVEETKIDDYDNYVKIIIDAGYTEDKYESSAENLQMYVAKSTEGIGVTVSFMNDEGILSITADASGKQ